MAFQFKGFKATRPVARAIDTDKKKYEAFFIYYDSSGKKYHYRCSKNINRLPPSQRLLEARAMAYVLWEGLQAGWNPLKDNYPSFIKDVEVDEPLTFGQALDFAITKKELVLSKFSMYDYRGCVKFMKAAAKEVGILNELIKNIKRRDIRLIVATAKELNGWSNNARNKYLTILSSLLTVLVDEERIEYNPAYKIKAEATSEGIGYKRLTDDNKEKIAKHLLEHAPDFFEYLMFIYDDGIRPNEVLGLRVQDVRLSEQEILIRAEVAKTNKARLVPITATIMEVLLRREIWKLPPDYFIFSSDKFKPGPGQYHRNTATKLWNELVIKDLNIDCKMYSLKHKGADDKILANVELDALRNLYGHRSQQMTEGYARAIRGRYKQSIIDKAPAFAKVVQMKRRAN